MKEGEDLTTKKFYWLKLKNTFFNQKEIKLLRRIAGGDTYTVIYLKLMLLSLENEGTVFFENVTDKFEEELALELDEDVENIQVTLSFLKAKGLLEIKDDDEYFLNEVPTMIGKESESASRVRKHRKNKREAILIESNDKKLLSNESALHGNAIVTSSNTEIEIDKELEKDKELKLEQEQKAVKINDNNDKLNPFTFYQENGFGTIAPLIRDKIVAIHNDFKEIGSSSHDADQLIIKALEMSVIRNIRNWAYAEKILINWHHKGFKTVTDVDASEKQFQASKNRGTPTVISEETSKATEELLENSRKRLAADVANTSEEDFSLFR